MYIQKRRRNNSFSHWKKCSVPYRQTYEIVIRFIDFILPTVLLYCCAHLLYWNKGEGKRWLGSSSNKPVVGWDSVLCAHSATPAWAGLSMVHDSGQQQYFYGHGHASAGSSWQIQWLYWSLLKGKDLTVTSSHLLKQKEVAHKIHVWLLVLFSQIDPDRLAVILSVCM